MITLLPIRALLLLASVACAEAETTTLEDQRAVAAVVVNRAMIRGTTLEQEIFRPSQFADLSYCAGGVKPVHVYAATTALIGMGLPEWFDKNVTHFVAPYAMKRVRHWKSKMEVAGRVKRGHVFWRKRG